MVSPSPLLLYLLLDKMWAVENSVKWMQTYAWNCIHMPRRDKSQKQWVGTVRCTIYVLCDVPVRVEFLKKTMSTYGTMYYLCTHCVCKKLLQAHTCLLTQLVRIKVTGCARATYQLLLSAAVTFMRSSYFYAHHAIVLGCRLWCCATVGREVVLFKIIYILYIITSKFYFICCNYITISPATMPILILLFLINM